MPPLSSAAERPSAVCVVVDRVVFSIVYEHLLISWFTGCLPTHDSPARYSSVMSAPVLLLSSHDIVAMKLAQGMLPGE